MPSLAHQSMLQEDPEFSQQIEEKKPLPLFTPHNI